MKFNEITGFNYCKNMSETYNGNLHVIAMEMAWRLNYPIENYLIELCDVPILCIEKEANEEQIKQGLSYDDNLYIKSHNLYFYRAKYQLGIRLSIEKMEDAEHYYSLIRTVIEHSRSDIVFLNIDYLTDMKDLNESQTESLKNLLIYLADETPSVEINLVLPMKIQILAQSLHIDKLDFTDSLLIKKHKETLEIIN